MTELLTTYLLHSTVILGITLLLIHLPGLRRAAARDVLLRAAFIVSLITPWGLHAPAQVSTPLARIIHEV